MYSAQQGQPIGTAIGQQHRKRSLAIKGFYALQQHRKGLLETLPWPGWPAAGRCLQNPQTEGVSPEATSSSVGFRNSSGAITDVDHLLTTQFMQKVFDAAVKVLKRAEMRDKLATQGMDPAPNASPADFKAANLREAPMWAKLIAASGAKVD